MSLVATDNGNCCFCLFPSKTPDRQSGVFVCYPQRQIEYTTSATAIAIPAVVNASGQVIVKHPPRLSVRFAPGSPSPYPAV
ncbi:hypothetical protein, partial [Escherichia coli]|uniref:hypothetical protein n=1 Tax=Escherichia coli TaxID=562 RepID=UPI001BC95C5C